MKEAIKLRNQIRLLMAFILLLWCWTALDFITGKYVIGAIMALINLFSTALTLTNLRKANKLVARWKKIEAEHQAAVDEVREKLMKSLDKTTGSQGDASDVGMGSDYTPGH